MSSTRKPKRGEAALAYCRTRDLPKLLAFWPCELADESLSGRERMIAKLRRALRAERRRGAAGHWTYDLARHALLLSAYQAERSACDQMRAAASRLRDEVSEAL